VVAVTVLEIEPDRLAKLHGALGDMDEALRDEGFDASGSHGVYVRWQRACVEALGAIVVEAGKTNLAALGEIEALLATARREGEADRRRIERMIEAGSNALAMTHRASENAGMASAHAQQMVNEGVAGIQARMSKALVEGCPQWLIFEQTERHRQYAWRRLAWGVVIGGAVFFGGCIFMQWWSAKESAAHQAVLEAVDRCLVEPRMVRMADGKTVEMCRLADLTTDRPN
jgi:hypothetical protein